MDFLLPDEVASGATLRGNEYGWAIASFLNALAAAEQRGLACVGGQFQFRTPNATCEMYWLAADSSDRLADEPWADYVRRSCKEVADGFQHLINTTDFDTEASRWTGIQLGAALRAALVFVAYFVTEQEFLALGVAKQSSALEAQ